MRRIRRCSIFSIWVVTDVFLLSLFFNILNGRFIFLLNYVQKYLFKISLFYIFCLPSFFLANFIFFFKPNLFCLPPKFVFNSTTILFWPKSIFNRNLFWFHQKFVVFGKEYVKVESSVIIMPSPVNSLHYRETLEYQLSLPKS